MSDPESEVVMMYEFDSEGNPSNPHPRNSLCDILGCVLIPIPLPELADKISHIPVMREHPLVKRALAAINDADTTREIRELLIDELTKMVKHAEIAGRVLGDSYQRMTDDLVNKIHDD